MDDKKIAENLSALDAENLSRVDGFIAALLIMQRQEAADKEAK